LESLAKGTPEEIVLQAMMALGAAPERAVVGRSSLGESAGRTALLALPAEGSLVALEPDSANRLITTRTFWQTLAERAQQEVKSYHRQNPLRLGMPREELKSRLKLDARLFNAMMAILSKEDADENIRLIANEKLVRLVTHSVQFSPAQKGMVDRLLARFAADPFSPPSVKEAQADVGVDVYNALVDLGQLVQVSPEVVYRQEDYARLLAATREMVARDGQVTVASFRDQFQTSRKYALGFLEHLDAVGITVREGDVRRLRK
jgi:selenocysteine-specific elongation factor